MYQVERQTGSGYWYKVMLSPFKTLQEAQNYLNKYQIYYDNKNNTYRITQQKYEKNGS